mgnify:CR=1 FL=1
MPTGTIIVVASFLYVGLLFAIAYYGDKRADEGRSIIANPYIYALSLAVYCTSWTFYGSVGRATTGGFSFLTIYLGPTIMFLFAAVILKMIRISKTLRLTSIADFISARYGKSQLLAGLVTIIAVIGIIPYIALQLKAISYSLKILFPADAEALIPDALEALGVWPAVSSRIAPGENVRAAMALVARGEAPLGIVYRTDVLAESRVRVIGEFPASLHSPIVYPAAVLAESRSPSAQVLLQFLRSAEARSVWRKYGFVVEAAGR